MNCGAGRTISARRSCVWHAVPLMVRKSSEGYGELGRTLFNALGEQTFPLLVRMFGWSRSPPTLPEAPRQKTGNRSQCRGACERRLHSGFAGRPYTESPSGRSRSGSWRAWCGQSIPAALSGSARVLLLQTRSSKVRGWTSEMRRPSERDAPIAGGRRIA